MLYVVFEAKKSGFKQRIEKTWHVGSRLKAEAGAEIGDVEMIQADGDELRYLTEEVKNLVHLDTWKFPVQIFRGDTAKFIVENLIKLEYPE